MPAGGQGIKLSPKGLAIAPLGGWGVLRYSSNAAFMSVLLAKRQPALAPAALAFARTQIDYMLGLAGSHRSYVVGYGTNPPTQPHHRAASCPPRPAPCGQAQFSSPAPNPQVRAGGVGGGRCSDEATLHPAPPRQPPSILHPLTLHPQVLEGALVGGPNEQDKYVDTRSDYQVGGGVLVGSQLPRALGSINADQRLNADQHVPVPPHPSTHRQANEVAVDYNAGFTGALAGLIELLGTSAGGGGGAAQA